MSSEFREVLLIGGYADGERRKVRIDKHGAPIAQHIIVPERQPLFAPLMFARKPTEVEHRYEIVALRSADSWQYVFVAREYRDKVLEQLIKGYRGLGKEEEECKCSKR